MGRGEVMLPDASRLLLQVLSRFGFFLVMKFLLDVPRRVRLDL